ncbi:MAG: hypothetical protein JJE15_10335 [Desulfobacteraceae bacterium]|nr:hypothetical protein [Desulfobacteraceae bacterium]
MSKLIQRDQWVWVVIQDPGKNEQFLGQQDQEKDESFIPVFLEKEEAQRALGFLAREEGHTYEAQAILYEDLAQRGHENGFMLMVLSGSGEVLERITK